MLESYRFVINIESFILNSRCIYYSIIWLIKFPYSHPPVIKTNWKYDYEVLIAAC